MLVQRIKTKELNVNNPGVEDAIGKVVQHMRDGQVIRSVVMTGVLNEFDAPKNYYFKVYPDSKVRMATSVNVMDVDRFVKPEEVDEFYNENAALHKQMHDAFSKYIRATRHPSFDSLDPVLADYYKQYFGITLI